MLRSFVDCYSQDIRTNFKLCEGWSAVVMREALLVFVARNAHDVAAGDIVVGAKSHDCSSNAVIGVFSGKTCQLGNSGHHLLQVILPDRSVFIPNRIIFGKISPRVLKRMKQSFATMIQLGQVELHTSDTINFTCRFIPSSSLLRRWLVVFPALGVFGRFIVCHVACLRAVMPYCWISKLSFFKALWPSIPC